MGGSSDPPLLRGGLEGSAACHLHQSKGELLTCKGKEKKKLSVNPHIKSTICLQLALVNCPNHVSSQGQGGKQGRWGYQGQSQSSLLLLEGEVRVGLLQHLEVMKSKETR